LLESPVENYGLTFAGRAREMQQFDKGLSTEGVIKELQDRCTAEVVEMTQVLKK
jgi:hypothetical protein